MLRHIERLHAACTLKGQQIFRDFHDLRGNSLAFVNPRGLTPLRCSATCPDMTTIKTVCVYCGSGPGTNPRFVEAAIAFGKTLAEDGIRLVYGGGSIGLMGAVAQVRARSRRRGHRHHSRIPDQPRKRAQARAGADRHARHARAQAADVRALRRLRGAARRHRHAGGTGGATDLAAARPPHQAGAARQHRRLLGAAAGPARAYARNRIHPAQSAGRYSEGRTGRGYPAAPARRRARAPEAGKEMAPELASKL